MKKYILMLPLFAIASTGHAASFDCTKAVTLVEKAICTETQLSHLDELLARAYRSALAASVNTDVMKAQQRAWLLNKRNKCQTTACLLSVYQERFAALNKLNHIAQPVMIQHPNPPVDNSIKQDKPKRMEGYISSYECGDNCYLTIMNDNGQEYSGLCHAAPCAKWREDGGIPETLQGQKVIVTIGDGVQYDSGGNVVGYMDAFEVIDLIRP